MKRELPYFTIGESYGGSQSWFLDPWMHIGGCGALTMCDVLIYLAKNRGRPECYPYDINRLTRRDYKKFGMMVKPYLRPRESGIKDLKTFVDGARVYLEDSEIEGFTFTTLDGHKPYEEAEAAVRDRIDASLPVPMLMLKHGDKRFDFFEWHWFPIIGYDEEGENGEFQIKVATYSKAHWLPFRDFWGTSELERGGLVLIEEQPAGADGEAAGADDEAAVADDKSAGAEKGDPA
ncbi:MAG: hypothetical protein IJI20_06165 [Firmicutes bacterium]|nr:hypothetical protein [Bacillota bacterium]